MRTFLLALLLAFAPLAFVASSGCTTSQKTVAYKSLNITATSVDAGMKAFADAVVAGKV
jgi:outer membrane protein assembly factor BamE (lipoprotein component of BamABCDE complex)